MESTRTSRRDHGDDLEKLRPAQTFRGNLSFIRGHSTPTFEGLLLLYTMCATFGAIILIAAIVVLISTESAVVQSGPYYIGGCESMDVITSGALNKINGSFLRNSEIAFYNSMWFSPSKPIKYSGISDFNNYLLTSSYTTSIARDFSWSQDFTSYAFQANDFLIAVLIFKNSTTTINNTNFNYIYYFDGFDSVRPVIEGLSYPVSIDQFGENLSDLSSTIDSYFPVKRSLCQETQNINSIMYTSLGFALSVFNASFIILEFVITRQWFAKLEISNKFIKDSRKGAYDLYLVLEDLWTRVYFIENTLKIDVVRLNKTPTQKVSDMCL